MKTIVAISATILMSSLAMAAEDTMMSPGSSMEQADVMTSFKQLDGNEDRYISKEEAADTTVGDYFTSIDTDQDSKISEGEYGKFADVYPAILGQEQEEAE